MTLILQLTTRSPRPATSRGFTFVEVLVALTILGIMLSIILASIRLGIGSWEKGDKINEDTQKIRSLVSRLSNEIGSMYPYIITVTGGAKEYTFKGERDALGFVTANEDSMPDMPKGGFKWVMYSVRKEENLEGLAALEKMLPDTSVRDDSKGRITLIEPAVKEIGLEYQDSEGTWADAWDANGKKDMPAAIKVRLLFKEQGRLGGSITLVIPTRMTPMLPKQAGKGAL